MVELQHLPRITVFGDIGFLKFYAMAILSSLGFDFIFSEMDVLVLQNPWPYHEREDTVQWRKDDCRHYPHNWPGRHPKSNPRADAADIQITAHFNHPRVNIGYLYVRWTPQTMNFLLQLLAYYIGKCADHVLGYDRREATFVDLGMPDQNMFDALLRNHDHTHPKYADMPWDVVPPVTWKLLDFNVFGIFGRLDATIPWVTFHYAGEGRKVECWQGICDKMEKEQDAGRGKRPRFDECVRPWQGGKCTHSSIPTLQGSLHEMCLGIKIPCSPLR
eukprot:TRINITY_DN45389_c0_g1_i1.p1 TRINITY_DN45389_c0_g1~~TRINITY_DN45389_c0_g1_i1.p1  ORF type:complete len:298 (-),score=20.26 TRINITY_DN45389_c0_g1_i1:678-1499(-)